MSLNLFPSLSFFLCRRLLRSQCDAADMSCAASPVIACVMNAASRALLPPEDAIVVLLWRRKPAGAGDFGCFGCFIRIALCDESAWREVERMSGERGEGREREKEGGKKRKREEREREKRRTDISLFFFFSF